MTIYLGLDPGSISGAVGALDARGSISITERAEYIAPCIQKHDIAVH